MPEKASPSPKCALGTCACIPICQDQAARVSAFLSTPTIRNFHQPVSNSNSQSPPPGQLWFCQVCATVREAPGVHCGTRIILIEARDVEWDSNGRIVRVTYAQNMRLYRKAPAGSLIDWKKAPHG